MDLQNQVRRFLAARGRRSPQLQAELDTLKRERDGAIAECENLRAQLRTFREAATRYARRPGTGFLAHEALDMIRDTLRFYAKPENWQATGWQGDQDPSPCEKDGGAKAREVLGE